LNSVGESAIDRLFARFTTISGRKIRFHALIFLFDFLAFVILLLGYGSWRSSGSGFAASIGSAISPFFVLILVVHFTFLIVVHVATMRKQPFFFCLISYLDAVVSFVLYGFVIPQMTESGCLDATSYRAFAFFRLTAQLFISCQFACGFLHTPPRISSKRPLFTMLYEIVFRIVPFLFEIVTSMQWIASRTTIGLFDYFVIKELKSKLLQRRASRVLFPQEKQKGRIEGILLLAGFIALLFVPLMIMSSRETGSLQNPATVASAHFGISGLPTFYDNEIPVAQRTLNDTERTALQKFSGASNVARFWQSPDQVQVLEFPTGSMVQWMVSPDAVSRCLAQLNDTTVAFTPYGSISLSMTNATTTNRATTVAVASHGAPLDDAGRRNLSLALNRANASISVPNLLPLFVTVGYDETPRGIAGFTSRIDFKVVIGNESSMFWEIQSTPDGKETPAFMQQANKSTLLVWSEKVPDAITGTVLASTGGILGLYSFVLLTIGQWIGTWVKSLFIDLWLTRMINPQKLLNVVLALEAYELLGESDKEFELAELLLENLRSTPRVVQMTNVIDPEA
jgi:hypothetical protein